MSHLQFSSRLNWETSTNPVTTVVEQLTKAGRSIIDLTQSNPTRVGFDYGDLDLRKLFDRDSVLAYDPCPLGAPAVRKTIAQYYAEKGADVSADRIVLTASTSEAYSLLFRLFADPDDNVAIPQPCYPLFDYLASLDCAACRRYRLQPDTHWGVDVDSLRAAIDERTRAIVAVHPNNPTGSYLTVRDRDTLQGIAIEHDIPLIVDEVFLDYSLAGAGEAAGTTVGLTDGVVFTVSGLSKVSGLPQMKLSWIVVSGPEVAASRALDGLETIADMYLSVSAPVQRAGPALLEFRASIQAEIIARLKTNLEILRGELTGSIAEVLDVDGGWYAVLRLPESKDDQTWCTDILSATGVLLQPGYFYDFADEAYLVCSLLTPTDQLLDGIQRIQQYLKNHTDH